MKNAVTKREVPHCLAPKCNGLVKPDIVFFGESLPEEFHRNRPLPSSADLCIIMGTSLTVQPFASLPGFCAEGVPRLLINSERVGGLGSRADDVLLLGDCDAGVRKLASVLGWAEELDALWEQTNHKKVDIGETPEKSKNDALQDEITALTKDVEKSLSLSSERTTQIREELQ